MSGAKPAVPGAVIEIPTTERFAYGQYVGEYPEFGSLVRILPNTFKERPSESQISNLAAGPELYFVLTLVPELVRDRQLSVAGYAAVPASAQQRLIFKVGGVGSRGWWLWDGDRQWRVDTLLEEQREFPSKELVSISALADRIEQGWRPRDDTVDRPSTLPPAHILEFPTLPHALQAVRELERKHFGPSLRQKEKGRRYRVRVVPPEGASETRDEQSETFRALGSKFGGNYLGFGPDDDT